MTVFRLGLVTGAAHRIDEQWRLVAGFAVMGISLAVLPVPRALVPVLTVVGLLALGVALVTPTLGALVSKRAGAHTGAALGAQSAANSLGQALGSVFGAALFSWQMDAAYVLTGGIVAIAAVLLAWTARLANGKHAAPPA